jgi:hypothetical protein
MATRLSDKAFTDAVKQAQKARITEMKAELAELRGGG